jgi:uncharacterized SAM-binding protein YcdF (DUF218 family)
VGAPGEQVLNARAREAELSAGRGWTWRTPWIKQALVLLVILGLVGVLLVFGVSRLGYWLVVADPLEPSRAIVVLSGRVPFRAMEAASIYRQKWAPEVWLTKEVLTAEDMALDQLGVHVVPKDAYNREVLGRLGVPASAIRVLQDSVWNTVDETRLVARELRANGADRVILVTSKTHSRRVRATWADIIGASPRAVVRYASEEPYNPEQWWRNTRDALDVSREAFGLLNVWAGFPIQPDRSQGNEGRR